LCKICMELATSCSEVMEGVKVEMLC